MGAFEKNPNEKIKKISGNYDYGPGKIEGKKIGEKVLRICLDVRELKTNLLRKKSYDLTIKKNELTQQRPPVWAEHLIFSEFQLQLNCLL